MHHEMKQLFGTEMNSGTEWYGRGYVCKVHLAEKVQDSEITHYVGEEYHLVATSHFGPASHYSAMIHSHRSGIPEA